MATSAQPSQPPAAPVVRDVQPPTPGPVPRTVQGSASVPRREISTLINHVNQLSVRYEKQRHARQRTVTKLSSAAHGSPWYVSGGTLTIASAAELLSLVSLGWLISWLIPIVSWYMVRQTNNINDAGNEIYKQRDQLAQQIRTAQQRLRPAITKSGQSALLASSAPSPSRRFSSYVRVFVRDTVATQLVELIPGINAILPLYLVQVIKVIVQQRQIRKDVIETVPEHQKAAQLLDSLERFEVQYTSMEAEALLARTLQEASRPVAA